MKQKTFSTICEENYYTLLKLIPFLNADVLQGDIPDYRKTQSEGFMDLSYDLLEINAFYIKFSLAHYYIENGDLIPDPDMIICLFPRQKMVEAMSYQDCYIYKQVYLPGGLFNTIFKVELNEFLKIWLNNLLNQGFRITI